MAGVVLMFVFAGCSSEHSETRHGDKRYVWIPPRTGSNVGRWVAKDDETRNAKARDSDKKRRAEKRAEAKKAKVKEGAPESEPVRESSPPERFR